MPLAQAAVQREGAGEGRNAVRGAVDELDGRPAAPQPAQVVEGEPVGHRRERGELRVAHDLCLGSGDRRVRPL